MTAIAQGTTPSIPADLADLQLLDKKQVCALVGLKSTSIDDRVRAGTFPEPIRMGARCTRWPAGAVRQWIRAQIEADQQPQKQRQLDRAQKALQGRRLRQVAGTSSALPA